MTRFKRTQYCPYCEHDESPKAVKCPGETYQFCDDCAEMYSVRVIQVLKYETEMICDGCSYRKKKCKCKEGAESYEY